MTFEYLKEIKFQDTIDIEDIGNFVLEALNDNGDQWFLYVKTEMGWSTVIICNGLTADSNSVDFGFGFSFSKMEYSEKSLCKLINKFITDDSKKITQIFFSDVDVLAERLKNLEEFQIIL